MRRWLVTVALLGACGSDAPAAPPPSSATTSSTVSHEETPLAEATVSTPAAPADAADCDRVQPCAEAFSALVPPELAAPAHVAVQQLDHSLAESPSRAAACSAAIASFRADLERLSIDVPEACRARP